MAWSARINGLACERKYSLMIIIACFPFALHARHTHSQSHVQFRGRLFTAQTPLLSSERTGKCNLEMCKSSVHTIPCAVSVRHKIHRNIPTVQQRVIIYTHLDVVIKPSHRKINVASKTTAARMFLLIDMISAIIRNKINGMPSESDVWNLNAKTTAKTVSVLCRTRPNANNEWVL